MYNNSDIEIVDYCGEILNDPEVAKFVNANNKTSNRKLIYADDLINKIRLLPSGAFYHGPDQIIKIIEELPAAAYMQLSKAVDWKNAFEHGDA